MTFPFLYHSEAAMPSKAVVETGDPPLGKTLHWGYTGRDHVVFRFRFRVKAPPETAAEASEPD